MPVALTNGEVLLLVAFIVLPIAGIAFAGAGAALKQLGKGQFAIEQELPQKTIGAVKPVSKEVQEAEVRQMLEAKSYRRVARGEQPLDVDAEVARLLQPTPAAGLMDEGLREEVRQLVVARNERRMRRGDEPLEVDQEVERQLRELENLGQ